MAARFGCGPRRRRDERGLLRFVDELSDESRYLRFHGFVRLDEQLVAPFLDPDWTERGAFIATLADERGRGADRRARELRAPARRDRGRGRARRRGRAPRTRHRHAPARAARGPRARAPASRASSRAFSSGNAAAHRALRRGRLRARAQHARRRDRAALRHSRRPTPSRLASRHATTARSRHRCATSSSPSTVAVVGASRRRGTIGGELFRNILDGDFDGAAYPVNLRAEPVAGVRAWSSIDGDPGRDRPRRDLRPGRAGARRGALRAAPRRARAVRDLRRLRRGRRRGTRRGRTHCSPPCGRTAPASSARTASGSPSPAPHLNATFAPRALPPGRIGFSSQSGALGLALLEKAAARGLGFSSFISIGNKADVSSNDLLEWWEDDPDTDVVLLYLESFGNPRRFAQIARRVARRKPILALKAGSSGAGARAAGSHTAALAGSDAAADALFAAGRRAPRAHARGADRHGRRARQPAAAARPARRGDHERRRARDPLRRRVRGGRALAARALRADARGARRGASRRGEHRQPRRPARLGDRRRPTGRRFRSSSPIRTSTR